MNQSEYVQARDAFFKVIETQPHLLHPIHAGTERGKQLAETAWGFIAEFTRQHKEQVKG